MNWEPNSSTVSRVERKNLKDKNAFLLMEAASEQDEQDRPEFEWTGLQRNPDPSRDRGRYAHSSERTAEV